MKDGEFWFDSSRRQAEQLEIQHQIQARPELDLGFADPMQRRDGQAGESRRGKKTEEPRTRGSNRHGGRAEEPKSVKMQTQKSSPLGGANRRKGPRWGNRWWWIWQLG